jgi:hypothetical protein
VTDNALKVVSYVGTLLVGFFVRHISDKFKYRTVPLRYSVTHTYLGSSASDTALGAMKVTFNELNVESLYQSQLVVENPTSKDLTNLVLKIYCDMDSAILTSHATKPGALAEIEFSQSFLRLIEEEKEKTLSFSRRDYLIPVLNRHDKIEVRCVITNFKKKNPSMWASLDEKGVSLKEVPVVHRFMGEPQQKAAYLGSFVTILLCPIIYLIFEKSNVSGWWTLAPILFAAVLGIVCLLPGVVVLKTIKGIGRFLN